MCGINCIINDKQNKYDVLKMHHATKHRGNNCVYQEMNGAKVAFNWLQITDKSISRLPNEYNGTIVYLNGFISNYKELATKYKIELETDCDIEFLAKFLDMQNGNKLDELNGFFSVIYWSPFYKDWFRFTDRYGIKQLYKYTNTENITFISSEPKAIFAVCQEIELDENRIEDWKCTLGVMNENTIYKGIKRVQKLPMITPKKIDISYEDAKKELSRLLLQSFKRNQYNGKSGVYLSGGIDSGIIAKYMAPEYCFSVDYIESDFSEIELIKKNSINNHLSLIINKENAVYYAKECMNALDDLKAGSCYTNFAIAELASKFVQVVYSGAGGDEFFGGYPHRKTRDPFDSIIRTKNIDEYFVCPKEWNSISHFEYDLKFLDAVLVVEDRMNAHHTMETRYPLLDNDLVNFALSLPDEYLENKRILKDVCGLHEDVINGKKRGFSNPYFTNDEWVEFTIKNLKR